MLIPLYTRIYFAYCVCLKRVTAEYNSVIKSDNYLGNTPWTLYQAQLVVNAI